MNETCLSQPEASRQLRAAIVMANSMRSGVYSSSSGSLSAVIELLQCAVWLTGCRGRRSTSSSGERSIAPPSSVCLFIPA